MTVETKAADVLRQAAELVQKNGLCKGDFVDDEGRLCMWGALNTTMYGHPSRTWLTGSNFENYVEVKRLIQDKIREKERSLLPCLNSQWPGATFNDLESTDVKDVAKFLLQTADEIEVS